MANRQIMLSFPEEKKYSPDIAVMLFHCYDNAIIMAIAAVVGRLSGDGNSIAACHCC